MSEDEEERLEQRMTRIEVAVQQIGKTLDEIVTEQRAETRRQRFDGGRMLTISASVIAVLVSGASMFLATYLEPIKVQVRANELQTQKQLDWILDAQYQLGALQAHAGCDTAPRVASH